MLIQLQVNGSPSPFSELSSCPATLDTCHPRTGSPGMEEEILKLMLKEGLQVSSPGLGMSRQTLVGAKTPAACTCGLCSVTLSMRAGVSPILP